MTGWYRMHRGWMDHALFRGEAFSKRDAFQWLIQEAAFQPTSIGTKSGAVDLQRGQLSYSLRFMAKAWKWETTRVLRFLEAAVAAGIIERGDAAGQTLITICNYNLYQADQRGGATAAPVVMQQPRNSGATKNKEGKEGKKGGVARAGAREAAAYAFEGRTVRLTVEHFNAWAAAYPHIADLRAELEGIDVWWERQEPAKRSNWFARTSGMLDKRNRENLASVEAAKDAERKAEHLDELRRAEFARNHPEAVARYAEMDRMVAEARARDAAYAAGAAEAEREIN